MTPRQIKAARVLLEWTQEDLAKMANMSKNAIANIESGYVLPRQQSLNAIRDALEGAGIEFIDTHGVQMKKEMGLS